VQGVFGSGSTQGEGIAVYLDAASATGNNKVTATITNNHVSGVVASRGAIDVYVFNKGTTVGQMKATVQGNVIDTMDQTNSFAGMYFQTGSATGAGGDNDTSCLTIGGAGALKNTIDAGTNASFAIAAGIFIEQEGVSKVALPGYGGSAYDTTAVQNFVAPNNTTTGGGGVTQVTAIRDSASPAGGGYFGNCANIGITIPNPGSDESANDNLLKFAPGGIDPVAKPKVAAPVEPSVANAPAQESTVSNDSTPRAITTAPVDEAALQSIVGEAKKRWLASGLTLEQAAALDRLNFELADLPELHLGSAATDRIKLDRNANGRGWYVESAPENDSQFATIKSGTQRYTDPNGAPAGRLDLLTAVMHEMGHALGLPDIYDAKAQDDVMYGFLTTGQRRLPRLNQASGAIAGSAAHAQYLGGGVTIPTLPAGKSVVIKYTVANDNPTTAAAISNQGMVTAAEGINVSTDDPTVGGASDPTVTLVEQPPVVTNVSVSVNEDATKTFAASDFTPGFSDPNAADTLQKIKITSLPTNGVLKNNGTTITSGDLATLEISNFAQLTYTPNADYNGADTFGWNGS
ncbi:MAG TPA: Ig-like domain-containing protein, partial [Chthoniobacterales bacterium]